MRRNPATTETRREIPRREWKNFFQQLSKDYQEWLVAVEGQRKGSNTLHEATGLPFEALTLHLDHEREVLSLIVRKDPKNDDVTRGHVYLSIPRPRRVMIERAESDMRLHIDSTNRGSTIIRFNQVATPDYESEVLSGVPEHEKPSMADRKK